MNKEEILEDFFRSLRVALTNAFSYSKDHPYFIKSVESFKLQLEATLAVLNLLKIGITNSGLVVDARNLIRSGFYDELARLLHQRKIKSIEIRRGASLEELIQFLSVISMPQKEIFGNGGINTILQKKQLAHFTIEELDYSIFLHGEGRECADLWGHMFKDALKTEDAAGIEELADNFGSLIKQINEKDIFGDKELFGDINEFLVYLKDKDKDKFDKCAKDAFLGLLHNKKSINEEKLAKFKLIFNSLKQEDFSALLWEGLLKEDNFDSLSLQLFSKISNPEDAGKISASFSKKINGAQYLRDNPKVVKKIQNLLGVTKDDSLSAVYRNTLESLVKGISFSGKLFFDQKMLRENYRHIVLSMLITEQNKDSLQLAAGTLEKELANIINDEDFVFLTELGSQLDKRNNEAIYSCIDLRKKFSESIENIVLGGQLPFEQESLIEMVKAPGREINFYLDKIFTVGGASKQILRLFFRLFAGNLGAFYARIEQKLADTEFLASLLDALSELDAPVTLDVLEYIYTCANQLIKLEVLKALRKLGKVDTAFLMRQLNTDSLALRRALLSVLALDAKAREPALDLLLKIPSPWGTKNKLLIENTQIVFELGLKEAVSRVADLTNRRFFWNKGLRDKANDILKEWNVY